jgi:phage tail P2-like protein
MTDRLAPDVIALDDRFGPLADATKRIEQLPLDGLLTYLVETVPAAFLPELARQFHIGPMEGWQFVGTDADRRRLIRESIALHRKKGTPWALRRAFQMAGFGDQLRIIEGALNRRYDGTIFADGSEKYGGHTWAEFRVEADLGETQGLSAETAAMAQALIAEWKPVSRHLTSLSWTVQTSDTAPSADSASATATWSGESLRPWRRMYDGQHRYDQGVLLAFDGATIADGSRTYQGWSVNDNHWRAGAPESDTTLAAAWEDSDRQQRWPYYDGITLADGSADYGHTAPVADDTLTDLVSTIWSSSTASSSDAVTTSAAWSDASLRPWRRYYDGSLDYGQGLLLHYDGIPIADGSRLYQGWDDRSVPLIYDGAATANGDHLYQGWTANDASWHAGAPESDTALALAWTDADRQQRLPLYDGATQADGSTDYGDAAPVADDAVMPITVTRFILFDGRYRYGADNIFDGTARFDGSRSYFAGRLASGNEITYLEAA